MNSTNVARRVWTDVLVKVVLRCKIVLGDVLARASIARRQFRGLSDWLAGTNTANCPHFSLLFKLSLLFDNLLSFPVYLLVLTVRAG